MEIFTAEITAESRQKKDGEFCSAGDIFRMLENAAGAHSRALGFSRQRLLKIGAVWILAGQRVDFYSMPRAGDRLTISTWPGKTRFALFPRHYRIDDARGNLLIRAASNWTLLSLETRSIVSPKKAGIAAEPVITGDELEMARHIPSAAEPAFTRRVRPEEIDANGHVNNAVYADWIGEYLTASPEGPRLPKIESISIQYRHELRPGDTAAICTHREEDRILITGICCGKTAFCASVR